MGTTLLIALLGLVGALALYQRQRRRQSLQQIKVGYRKARRGVRVQPNPHPYCAVSIQAGAGACAQARELGDQRFLSAEAPSLPLSACRTENCECRYQFYDDRRTGEDRRGPVEEGLEDLFHVDAWQQRSGPDRRRASAVH